MSKNILEDASVSGHDIKRDGDDYDDYDYDNDDDYDTTKVNKTRSTLKVILQHHKWMKWKMMSGTQNNDLRILFSRFINKPNRDVSISESNLRLDNVTTKNIVEELKSFHEMNYNYNHHGHDNEILGTNSIKNRGKKIIINPLYLG